MNIQDIISQVGLIYDRHLNTTLSLPYSGFESIKIPQNELVTASVINMALTKLYDNFEYLYKSSRIASNVIPIEAIAFLGVVPPATAFSWYFASTALNTSNFVSLSNGLDNIKTIVGGINSDQSQYAFFSSTGTDLIIFRGNTQLSTISIALSTIYTGVNTNVNFTGINSLTLDSINNKLYVTDLSANLIYKYDASGFLTNNTILQNRLVYESSIGGPGGYDDKQLFNQPQGLFIQGQDLFVLDSGNSCIKRYDLNFNWKITYRLFRDFNNAYPIDIMLDSNSNVYVLTEANTIIKYNNSFNNIDVITLPTLSSSSEYYKNIVPSPTDNNIYYLITNKNVYKRFVSDPNFSVGKYLFYLYGVNTPENISSFTAIANNANDNNLIFSNYNGIGKFGLYFDNLNLIDVLVSNNFDVYTPDDITVNNDEYVQNWVLNKSITKLITNHMRLRDQIIGKFLYKRDTNNNVIFQGIRYTLPDELTSIAFQQDITNFIGCNEIFQNVIFNRALKKIFDIQVSMLNILQADIQYNPDINIPVYID